MLLLIEFVIAALVIPAALFLQRIGNRLFPSIERSVSRFAANRRLAVLAVLVLALIGRILVLPIEPIPHPGTHDEFSYLLMADTFSHGRLTNPTHPMWKHFETIHVNQIPTYCSMYYPAQGLFLAFGQKFLGHPFWGVWLSTGLMCAAFCWALQAWVPPGWAFFGGLLAVARLGLFSYWANSYWGGSVAALGGALVLGALPRIQRYRRLRDAVIMATGLAILGNSRPYESVFYTLPIMFALGWSFFNSDGVIRKQYWNRVVVPAGAIVLLTLAAVAYYFKRCTGSPLLPPYFVNVRMYETAPLFPWQKLNRISYRAPSMARYELGWAVAEYESVRHHWYIQWALRAFEGGLFLYGPLLVLPWFVLGVVLPYGLSIHDLGPKTGLLMKIAFFSVLGMSLPVYFSDHYTGPVCCAFYGLEIQAMRRTCIFDRLGKQKGRWIVRYVILACVLLLFLRTFEKQLHIPPPPLSFADWESGGTRAIGRDAVQTELLRDPRQQLVLVRYTSEHNVFNEWVYNGADIDNSKIVWAHDMGRAENHELIQYFSSRKVWLLEPDSVPPRLSTYQASGGGAAP